MLSDRGIKEKVRTGEIVIDPYDPACLQPASYDLHLDNEFRLFKTHQTALIDVRQRADIMEKFVLRDDEAFFLHPKSFALALIKEKTGVDASHVGRLEGKSSLARLGLLIHTTAGFLDPGNSLKLTLELFNASPLPIKLYPGMKIAQIAFDQLDQPCERPYGTKSLHSKYFGDLTIKESEMYLNFQEKK